MNEKILEKKAYAKINLCLDVLGIREDGYHIVDMVMQQIGLYDDIELENLGKENAGKIQLEITDLRKKNVDKTASETECRENLENTIPADRNNLMYRAAELMIDKYKIASGIRMKLTKRIPSEAGLGGGSADAAAVFNGINELFKLGASEEELMKLSCKLGSDISFCIMGGTARAEGTGTDMTALKSLADFAVSNNFTKACGDKAVDDESACKIASEDKSAGKISKAFEQINRVPGYVLLVKPKLSGSTPKIYAAYDNAALKKGDSIIHPDINELCNAINEGVSCDIRNALIKNNIDVLEHAVCPTAPFVDNQDFSGRKVDIISYIKQKLINLGAVTSSMTGSGSVVYGLFDDEEKMHCAKKKIADEALTPYIIDIFETFFTDNR